MECCKDAEYDVHRSGASVECNCLPACNSLRYEAEVFQNAYDLTSSYSKSEFETEFDYEKWAKLEKSLVSHFNLSKLTLSIHNVSSSTFTRLVIAFKEEQFIPQQRKESQNAIDFIANAGGLVGLCIGASVLSFVELIYYLTLRIFFARQRNDQMIENPSIKAPKATRIYTILP